MYNIYKAFYNNTKRIVECQKGGSDAPQNKINEITAAINMMEEICKPDAEPFPEGQEDPNENS